VRSGAGVCLSCGWLVSDWPLAQEVLARAGDSAAAAQKIEARTGRRGVFEVFRAGRV
jgi:hypothetical protein